MIVTGYDKEIQQWVSNQLGLEKVGGDDIAALGIMENNEIVGGVIYHGFRKHMIDMSLATISPKWCTRANLKSILLYPFEQLSVVRVNAFCSKKNKKMRSILKRLGFREEGVLKKGFDGMQDAVCYGMLKQDCKWIK